MKRHCSDLTRFKGLSSYLELKGSLFSPKELRTSKADYQAFHYNHSVKKLPIFAQFKDLTFTSEGNCCETVTEGPP